MIACPFKLCSAIVDLVIEQAVADDDEGTVHRVPQHPTGGHEEFGLCPASLMVVPLDAYSRGQLDEQAVALLRIIRDREAAADNAPGTAETGQPEHQLAPHTDPRKAWNWFQNSARPPLRMLPADGSKTIGGNAMTSGEDIKNILVRAGELAEQARQGVFIAEGLASDALQLVNVARESSVDHLGAPSLVEAIRAMGDARTGLEAAIAAGVSWRSTR